MKRIFLLSVLFLVSVGLRAQSATTGNSRIGWTELIKSNDACPTRPYYSHPALQMNLELGSGYHFIPPYSSEHYEFVRYIYSVPVTVDFQIGCRINDIVFVGGGVMEGATWYKKEYYKTQSDCQEGKDPAITSQFFYFLLPVYACTRLYIPTKTYKVQPYFDLALGANPFYTLPGFGRASFGLEYNRFTWAVDYTACFAKSGLENIAEFKLGFRFGPVE